MDPTIEQLELLSLKRRKIELLQRQVQLKKENGLAFYKPHRKQDAFHRAGKFKKRAVFAGNRFGKSTMGCGEDVAWLLGERSWYPEGDPARKDGIPQRPVKGLVITTDWDKVDEIWTTQRGENPGKLWQMLPQGWVKSKTTNNSGAIDTVEGNNGSIIRFDTVKSWLNNPQGSESSDWDFVHVDEPCPEKMFKAASRGLIDRGGSSWFTLTPLKEVWITDMFFPRRRKDKKEEVYSEGTRWAIRGSVYDNTHLSREAIEEYASTLSADEKQCRLYGLPLDLSGLIYKEFDQDVHILKDLPHGWDAWNDPPLEYAIYFQLDPHPKTPHAVLFCAISPFGHKFLYDEIFYHCTVRELAELINPKLVKQTSAGPVNRHIIRKCMDPLGFIEDPITGTTMATEFEKYGLNFDKATKDLSNGILRVKQELKQSDNLLFSPMLENTLREIERYMWDDKKQRPVDADDHFMECLYRLCLMDMRHYPMVDTSRGPIDDYAFEAPNLHTLDLMEVV